MKKTFRGLALAMLMFILLQAAMVFPASAVTGTTVATNHQEAREAVVEVALAYTTSADREVLVELGSGYFIDASYVVTCHHVIDIEGDFEALANLVESVFGAEEKTYFTQNWATRTSYKIIINRDVTVGVTLTDAKSEAYDFAALKLNTPLNGTTVLAFGKDDDIEVGSEIACLGYPGRITGWTDSNVYKADDVAYTSGKVGKYDNPYGTDMFMHSAIVSDGSSGGPTILEKDGKVSVVGMVFARHTTETSYSYSLLIDEMCKILHQFGIPFQTNDSSSSSTPSTPAATDAACAHEWGAPVNVSCVPTYTCSKCQETKTDIAVHTYGSWTVSREATVDAAGEEKRVCAGCGLEETRPIDKLPAPAGPNMLAIGLIIAAVVIVIVVVVIIIVLSTGKKKPAPAPMGVPGGMPTPPPMGGAAPQAPYNAPRPPVPPVPPSNEGAGETTVLNDGAGETTVLGGGAVGTSAALIRVKNGERIAIASPEFVIGKEKRRVNYCISDNNSISRAHAKIIVRGGSCYAVDMNSTNFTFVNGTKLASGQEQLLNDGDKIKLSDEEFEFRA